MALEKDVAAAAEQVRKWRADYLRLAATMLDTQVEKLQRQAAEYRATADKLSPLTPA